MSMDEGELSGVTPRRLPRDAAEWMLYLFERLETTLKDGLNGVREEVAGHRVEFNRLVERVDVLEDERKMGRASRAFAGSVWKAIASLAGLAASAALIISVAHNVH